ncbi:MAG: hypothetical protein U1E76_28010 [Planctomycetota bacterium]
MIAPPGFIDLRGSVHVHSDQSKDGCASLDEIRSAAAAVGLDFIVVTDHNHRTASIDDGAALVVGGVEFGPHGHLLGIGHTEDFTSRQTREALRDRVHATGGIAIAAHPFDPREPFPRESLAGMDGMEIYSLSHDINQEGIALYLLKLLVFPFDRYAILKSVVDVPREPLDAFDAIVRERDFLGLGATDAHGCTGLTHAMAFSIVQTHVLARERSVPGILEALRARRAYVSFEYRHAVQAFEFCAVRGERRLPIGSTIEARPGWSLEIAVQPAATIRLLRDGEVAGNWPDSSSAAEPVTTPGAYRVEVWYEHQPWILSNVIRVVERHLE